MTRVPIKEDYLLSSCVDVEQCFLHPLFEAPSTSTLFSLENQKLFTFFSFFCSFLLNQQLRQERRKNEKTKNPKKKNACVDNALDSKILI